MGLLTLVCLICGNEKFFTEAPTARVVCDKCGSTTFRQEFTPTDGDEATRSQLEDTARSVALGDESPGTTPDDLRDLNNP